MTPLTAQILNTDLLKWLEIKSFPEKFIEGRTLTPQDILSAIENLEWHYLTEIQLLSWTVTIQDNSSWLSIEILRFDGDINHSQDMRFQGERELLARLLRALPKSYGMYLIHTDGEDGEIVQASNQT